MGWSTFGRRRLAIVLARSPRHFRPLTSNTHLARTCLQEGGKCRLEEGALCGMTRCRVAEEICR